MSRVYEYKLSCGVVESIGNSDILHTHHMQTVASAKTIATHGHYTAAAAAARARATGA